MAEFELPEGWVLTNLSTLCELNPKEKLDDNLIVGFMPMNGMPTDFLGNVFYDEKSWKEVKQGYTQFKNGDVLFAKITPCFENGKATIVEGFPNGFGAGSTEYFVLRTIDKTVHPKLLLALVKTKAFLTQGELNMSGSVGHKRVPKTFVEDYPFPLPPLAEQHEIAARLDTLLAQVDAAKDRLDGIPALLKRFRQSVLAAAVSGKLTEGWREENEISMQNWKDSNIGNVSIVSTGKTPLRSEIKYWEQGNVPWLTSAATGLLFCYKAEQFINELAVKECSLKLFPIGTLLLAMYGEGKTRGQVTELKIEATCNQACAAINVDTSKVLNQFIKLRLQENYEETRKSAAGGAQPNLNLNKVREITVKLPPLEEQTQIVTRVEALFAFADLIEARVKAAQAQVNMLTQAILAKAFRGELTAAWRAQHPELINGENSAEALLARIQTERGQSEKPTKKVGKKAGQARKAKSAAPVEAVGDDLPAGQLNLPGLLLPEVVEAGR